MPASDRRTPTWMLAVVLLALGVSRPAAALIEVPMPLKSILDQSSVVAVGEIRSVDAANRRFAIAVTRLLKGKTEFQTIHVNASVGQQWHPEALMRQVARGAPALVFYDVREGQIASLVHANGIFFQLFADGGRKPDDTWWNFTHVELKLRRTYDGPTPQLIALIQDVLGGKVKPPAPNLNVGFWTREELMGRGKPAAKAGPRLFGRLIPLAVPGGEARAVAWADYDGDGRFDALVCTGHGVRLFRNAPAGFRDVTAEAGLKGSARAGGFADYNADGRPDLLLVPNRARPGLWTNQGGRFADTSTLLPDLERYNGEGAGWVDADGDGRPDLLLTNGEFGTHLLLNPAASSPRLVDASAAWGLGPRGFGVANGEFLALADFDADGYVDFLYNVERGVLGRNREGKGFQRRPASGLDFAATGIPKVGVALGDFDADGHIDAFVPQRGEKPRLYHNNGDGSFTNVVDKAGDLAEIRGAQSAAWGDFDGDGRLDLVVAFADGPLRLYVHRERTEFENQSDDAGLTGLAPSANATGLAPADFDSDGRLDLLFVTDNGQAGVLVNTLPAPALPALRIRLPAQLPPGAVVRLVDEQDNLAALRQVGLADNFSSQPPPEVVVHLPPGDYAATVVATDGSVRRRRLRLDAQGASWQVPLHD